MVESDQQVSESEAVSEGRRCRCGHDKKHPFVRPVKVYSALGQIAFGLLFTPLPKAINLTCGRCGEIVHTITDPEALQRFRYREPRPDER
jgi:hypothetical protein